MNYYIQGSPARAKEIKAAFEKFGYDISWPGGCANPDVINIGVERHGVKYVVAETFEYIKDIIKTHPDYKELALPVEPFKVGDWIVRGKGFVYEPSLITEIRDYYICELLNGERVTYTLNDVHKNFHLWPIQDAKDGDVLATDNGWTCIFKAFDGCLFSSYCFMDSQKWFCEFGSEAHTLDSRVNGNIHPATKEQRDLLFAKMKEAGYEWDCEKKELRKIIKPKFKVGDVVLYYGGLYRVEDVLYTKKNGSFYNIGNLVRIPEIQLTLADHRDEIRILKGGEQ